MRLGDIAFGMFILILAYLLLINFKGTNAILSTSTSGLIGVTRTLQGR